MKKLFDSQLGKKILSVVTAIVIVVVSMPMANVSEKISQIVNIIRAAGADDQENHIWTITDVDEFISFAEAYSYAPETYCNYTIDFTASFTANDFEDIGTAEYPFNGTIRTPQGNAVNISLNKPLFAYISDSVKITQSDNPDNTDQPVILSASESMNTPTPLFAENVIHNSEYTDAPPTWNIKIESLLDNNDESIPYNFGGVIGTICENATVNLNITNKSAEGSSIFSEGDVGLACNTMGENSTLYVTINSESTNTDYTISSTNGNAGGLVGSMEDSATLNVNSGINYSGNISGKNSAGGIVGVMRNSSILKVNNSVDLSGTIKGNSSGGIVGLTNHDSNYDGAELNIYGDVNSTGEISGTYAGGVAGYSVDSVVNFENSPKVTSTVNGTSGTGGVFGYYKNNGNDKEFDISSYNIDCTLNGEYNGGLFGVLENNGSLKITDNPNENQIFPKRTSTEYKEYGGLIGLYASGQSSNTLEVSNVTVNVDKQGASNYYGGVIGYIDSASYVKFDDVTVNATKCSSNVYKSFGGLIGYLDKGFIDVKKVIVNTNGNFKGGGIVGCMKCSETSGGVLRLNGKTDLSNAKPAENNGQIVKERGPALIYADTDWELIRCDTTDAGLADDIYEWGEVLRFGVNENLGNVEDVLDVDETNHTVKVKQVNKDTEGNYEINNLSDFVKLALNNQLNNGSSTGTLCFEDTTKNSTLLSSTIELNTDIDLAGTGLTGLTRDDGINAAFTGKFNGNKHKISLAIGEPYGYRKNGEIEEPIKVDDTTNNNGSIYTHRYNGLFAKTGSGATFENLTISGKINVKNNNSGSSYIHVGGLTSVHNKSNITITSVTVNETIYLGVNKIATYAGGMIGKVASNSDSIISISKCTICPTIDTAQSSVSYYIGGAIGMIDSTSSMNISIDDVTVGEKITNKSTSTGKKTGGLIAYISNYSNGTPGERTMALKKVNVNEAAITANSHINNNSYYDCGGLLGQDWNNVDVTIGDKSDAGVQGVKVTSGTITNNGAGNFAGLVTRATGYWQVNDLNIEKLTVEGSSAKSFGMIVNNGVNTDNNKTFALYLELTGENAYKINKENFSATLKDDVIFDELLVSSTGAYDSNSNVTANGRAVVSIHTSDGKLKMDGENCNTYQNQTGRKISNRNCRYYYNLDVIRDKVTNGTELLAPEKLLLWSVNKYAHSSLSDYFENPFGGDTIPSGEYDMTGYSYYPVDVSGVTISSGAKFKFSNSEIENSENVSAENGNADSNARVTTVTTSQHYSMHFGLFRNMSGNINIKDITFSGNCGYTSEGYSGVLTYTEISGTSSNPTKATINGITLNGIKINNAKGALLIDRISSYSTVTISNVKTEKNSYNDSETAAQYLVRRVGGSLSTNASDIIVKFSNIVLDSRKNDLTNTTANNALTEAYGTTKSIFKTSTLIGTCQFLTTSNCSAVYNYKHSEDWNSDGTPKHNVTYGKEVSNSAEYDGKQEKYINSELYTSPEDSNKEDEEYDFSQNFLPYVATAYNADKSTHEIKVNHTNNSSLKVGCGTYNDPYIINNPDQLEFVANMLNNQDPISDDTIVNYTADNYKSWCNDKGAHKTYSWQSDGFYESVLDSDGGVESFNENSSIDIDDVRMALSTAYYQLASDIVLPDSFIGLGKSTDYPFKGVIYGANHTITNEGPNPFIYNSTGSVVKDLTVNVTCDEIKLSNGDSNQTKYETDGGNAKFYGGIIGIVNGGDNIIDNVGVTFTYAENISSDKTKSFYGNVAVGGYIGVVRYGGVIFRNMGKNANRSGITSEVNDKFNSDAENDFSDSSNISYLYFNPIIGRVIDGFAVTESDQYKYKESDATMKNGIKNYSIADINKNSDEKLSLTDMTYYKDKKNWDAYESTITIPDSQTLFLLGCITNSGAGKCDVTANAYITEFNLFGYGNNQMVRHGNYNEIGKAESSDFTDVQKFDKFSRDKAYLTGGKFDLDSYTDTIQEVVPYIIYKYTTESVSIIGISNGIFNYPARTVTSNGSVFYLELAENQTYNLPEGFRGIGSLSSTLNGGNTDDKNEREASQMYIWGIKGNNSTINLNTKYYTYRLDSSSYNAYGSNGYAGVGLFTSLLQNVQCFRRSNDGNVDYADDKYKIKDLTISGNVLSKIYTSETDKKLKNNYMPAGGLAGFCKPAAYSKTICAVKIENVKMLNLDVNSAYYGGGLIGHMYGNESTLDIIRCSADNLSVTAGQHLGGFVGHIEYFKISVDGEKTDGTNSEIKINTLQLSTPIGGKYYVGGLFGYLKYRTITIKNTDIVNGTITKEGNSSDPYIGGVIGYVDSTPINISDCNVKNVNLQNGGYSGGLVGYAYNSCTLKIENSNVIGDSTNNNMISSSGCTGGFVGWANLASGSVINNCTIKNYVLQANYSYNGGICGINNNNALIIKNCSVLDCNLKISNSSNSIYGVGGLIGYNSSSGLTGYNCVTKNVTMTDLNNNKLSETSKTSKGDVIGYNNNKTVMMVGISVQKDTEGYYADKSVGGTFSSSNGYVIYSDYNGDCIKENPNTTQSDINADNNVDDMEKSPYATINPKRSIGGLDITGDGISKEVKNEQEEITEKSVIGKILDDTTRYTNVANIKQTFKDNYSSRLSTFKNETGVEGLDDSEDFSVLTLYKNDNIATIVSNYINLLTNDASTSNYGSTNASKYNIAITQYKYDEENKSFSTSGAVQTLNSNLTAIDEKFDNQNKQFTLIDVQYKNPKNQNQVVYHLYVPVMVEKMLNFDFKAAALSGTNYKASLYEDNYGNTAMENYGTPVTSYVTYSYKRTAQEWIDAVANGENISKGYGKFITLKAGDGNNLPDDTKITIVDKNNGNKAYYSTIEKACTKVNDYTIKLDFSKFTAADGTTGFTPVSFETLLKKSGAVFEDGKITSFNGIDNNESSVDMEEKYYISFYTAKNQSNAAMRNIEIGCSSRLGDDGMIPSHRTSVKTTSNTSGSTLYAKMILGNLYKQNFEFKTTTPNRVMSDINNSVNMEMSTTISLDEGSKESAKTYLKYDNISLFHGFVIDATKTDNNGKEQGIKGSPVVNVSAFKVKENNTKPNINKSSVITIYSDDSSIKQALISDGSVKIECNADLNYELSEIIEQFPESTGENEFGTIYSANSNLAYSPETIESSGMSVKANDNISYYREAAEIALTTLSYNVPSTTADEQTNLGVNGRDKAETITADGYYNVRDLTAKDNATQVKFTLELYKKEDNGNYTLVNINDYLTDVKFGDINGTATDNEISYTADLHTVKGDVADTYKVQTSYTVKTGTEFENTNYFYSNYKVVLKAELLDESENSIENSTASDHIVYTNAKICTEFLTGTQ